MISRPNRTSAFTIIELLAVIAIVGLLATFSIQAFSSIGQARGATEAAYQISNAVETARVEAITRHTFVWLGLQPQTNSGNMDLRVGIVFSRDGTPNPAPTNLRPVGRSVLIQRVGLINAAGVANVPPPLSAISEMANYSAGATFDIGSVRFTGCTLAFSPLGEVIRAASPSPNIGFEPRIGIGLAQMRGMTQSTNNQCAVLIDGSVGIPTIYRK